MWRKGWRQTCAGRAGISSMCEAKRVSRSNGEMQTKGKTKKMSGKQRWQGGGRKVMNGSMKSESSWRTSMQSESSPNESSQSEDEEDETEDDEDDEEGRRRRRGRVRVRVLLASCRLHLASILITITRRRDRRWRWRRFRALAVVTLAGLTCGLKEIGRVLHLLFCKFTQSQIGLTCLSCTKLTYVLRAGLDRDIVPCHIVHLPPAQSVGLEEPLEDVLVIEIFFPHRGGRIANVLRVLHGHNGQRQYQLLGSRAVHSPRPHNATTTTKYIVSACPRYVAKPESSPTPVRSYASYAFWACL